MRRFPFILIRLLVLVLSVYVGGIGGGIIYSRNNSITPSSFDPMVLSAAYFSLYIPWMWSVILLTTIAAVAWFLRRCPWWVFLFPFTGSALLVYMGYFFWYTP